MNSVVCKHWCFVDDDGSWGMSYRCDAAGGGNISFPEWDVPPGRSYSTVGSYEDGVSNPDWGDIGACLPVLECQEWVHIAVTYDHDLGLASIYEDGELLRRGAWTTGAGGSEAPLVVGTDHLTPDGSLCGDNHYFQGAIDDVRIYGRALSDDEVLALSSPPATCDCVGDVDGNWTVDVVDFLALLAAWGPCPQICCPADTNDDGVVDVVDFLRLLANWGPCP